MGATYEILRDGRPLLARLFKSDEEILDFVRAQPPGVYDIHRELPRDPDGVRNSEPWGRVIKHENGEVSLQSGS
jgi:hypothetical protein